MSAIENLLIPGSTETPDCPCGAEMRLSKVKPGGEDTEIRIFKCDTCHHEFQLMFWKAPPTIPHIRWDSPFARRLWFSRSLS
jgi:hypothetical protein